MEREIKFRVWDKMNYKMYYLNLLDVLHDDNNNNNINLIFGKSSIIQQDEGSMDYELMQFTGLKDKNGVEIYEEDIYEELVEKGWLDKSLNKMVYKKYLIKMVVKMQINYCEEYGDIYGYPMDLEKREILGNTYKNPELSESDKNEM